MAGEIEAPELQAISVALSNSSNIENKRPPGRIKGIVRRMYVSFFLRWQKFYTAILPNLGTGATIFLTHFVWFDPGRGIFLQRVFSAFGIV